VRWEVANVAHVEQKKSSTLTNWPAR
jgi:hypothetical protein